MLGITPLHHMDCITQDSKLGVFQISISTLQDLPQWRTYVAVRTYAAARTYAAVGTYAAASVLREAIPSSRHGAARVLRLSHPQHLRWQLAEAIASSEPW